jgi:hypothetical protein
MWVHRVFKIGGLWKGDRIERICDKKVGKLVNYTEA